MPLEAGRTSDGRLLWVENPFTGVVTYLTDIHRKRDGFRPGDGAAPQADIFRQLTANCPFCPGNEAMTTEEVMRLPADPRRPWEIRAFYNLFPRIPEPCTGGRNESYVLVETPDHFREDAQHIDHLVYTAMSTPQRFRAIIRAAAQLTGRALGNTAVTSVVVRKNQGRDSGASQPHPHTQVIGSGRMLSPLAREREVLAGDPDVFASIVELASREGLVLAERDGCFLYFSPIGTFPRCYEVVDLRARGHLHEIPTARLDSFADLLLQCLITLGDTPLDYEIHADPELPLHAHVHSRHFPYSNIAGTLNLPNALLEAVAKSRD